ncbi:MAG: sigma-70 family RNA polymerase sigma factor [Polyangiaceae bacterium]
MSYELVQEAVAGDRRAIRRLVDELTPVVQARVARVLLRYSAASRRDPRQEVRDFVQQVMVALFQDGARVLAQWDPARGRSLHSFVSLVAEREAISTLRGRSQNPFMKEDVTDLDDLSPGDDAAGPEHITASRETLAAVLSVVRSRLGERGLSLFQLIFVEEMPPEDVAAAMGMTRDAVYAWQVRLRRMLREIAEEVASDPGEAPRKAEGRSLSS